MNDINLAKVIMLEEGIQISEGGDIETNESESMRYMLKCDHDTIQIPKCTMNFFSHLHDCKDSVHTIAGHAYIQSYRDGIRQQNHVDYLNLPATSTTGFVFPYVGLIAFETGTYIYIEGKKVNIPQYSCLIMRADVVHAGGEYKDSNNIRFHFYIDTVDNIASHGETVGWVSRAAKATNASFRRVTYSLCAVIENDLIGNITTDADPVRRVKKPRY
jgi:hypothetical protein